MRTSKSNLQRKKKQKSACNHVSQRGVYGHLLLNFQKQQEERIEMSPGVHLQEQQFYIM